MVFVSPSILQGIPLMSYPRSFCRHKTSGTEVRGIDDGVVLIEEVVQSRSEVGEVVVSRANAGWYERHDREDEVEK